MSKTKNRVSESEPPQTNRSRFPHYRPHHRLFIEKGSYIIKTAESSWELEAALRLRYRSFHQNRDLNKDPKFWDYDQFDLFCDHLIILHKDTRECVGTYRLLSSSYSKVFYSATEFHMDDFLETPGIKMELGRACIAVEHRAAMIIALLWKGILFYAQNIGVETVFGCSSVNTLDPHHIHLLIDQFEQSNVLIDNYAIKPREPQRLSWLEKHVATKMDLSTEDKSLPPLLATYLKAGAKVAKDPSIDFSVKCADFFTILDLKKMSARFQKKLIPSTR